MSNHGSKTNNSRTIAYGNSRLHSLFERLITIRFIPIHSRFDLVFLATFSFVLPALGQIPKIIDSSQVGVYPLQIGNLWQYWTYDYLNGQVTWRYGWTTKVIGDTLMPDGKTYSILKSDGGYGINAPLLQEDNKVISPGDNIFYNFTKTTGDTIQIIPRPQAKDSLVEIIIHDNYIQVFGLTKRQWGYYLYSTRTTAYILYEIVDGFGMTVVKAEAGEEWFLRGAIINGLQYGTITSVKSNIKTTAPTDFDLLPNYPNPFNARTIISFNISTEQTVTISIYDLLGRRVSTLLSQKMPSGTHRVSWNGKNDNGEELSSGVYIYQLQSQSGTKQRKMLMVK